MKLSKSRIYIIVCILTLLFLTLNLINKPKNLTYNLNSVSSFKISSDDIINLKIYSITYNLDFVKLLTYYTLENNFFEENINSLKLDKNFILNYNNLNKKYKNTNYKDYYNYFKTILTEIENFPLPLTFSTLDKYYYSDSWGAERTYGGNRLHLGTDIINKENLRETLPIISMTNGIVENLGWNEKGGYRIGIRTENNNYYYYAHLSSFSDKLEVGTAVKSGDFLGYMGDTGYSKIVGTTGNFPVHLHFGIEVNNSLSPSPFWINPYPFLSLIEYLNLNNIQN